MRLRRILMGLSVLSATSCSAASPPSPAVAVKTDKKESVKKKRTSMFTWMDRLAPAASTPSSVPEPTTTTSTVQSTTTHTHQPVTQPKPSRKRAPVRATAPPQPVHSTGGVWDRLAKCESGGNWQINTGNGYYGGLQFSLSTWRSVGGSGYPHQHSREEQINRGQILQARSGWGQWPACSRKLGLR